MNERLSKLIAFIFEEHEDHSGLDCETCVDQFTHLSELVARGASLHDLMPAVEQHLACCSECREHFEGLLSIIQAEFRGLLPRSDVKEG